MLLPRQCADVDGTLVPVITPEDLIVTKILARRGKDIEDVRAVIHDRRASLDTNRIRTVLGLLEEALTQNDLLPLFELQWHEEDQDTPTKKRSRPTKSKGKPKKRG